jgi:twitching motility two-component system response regulator PilH
MTSYSPASKAILCVQSQNEDRVLLADLLARYRTVFACSGYEALRELERGVFDAYVLDYWLSDWSGAQLCREIRKTDPNGPIVFCTAAAHNEDRANALRAGASAYLCKPVDPKRLLGELRVLLELGDLESLQARVEEERAIQEELSRRSAALAQRTKEAQRTAARALERISKAKAAHAFWLARGTRANFERWWPIVYAGACSGHEIQSTLDAGRTPKQAAHDVDH